MQFEILKQPTTCLECIVFHRTTVSTQSALCVGGGGAKEESTVRGHGKVHKKEQ